MITKEEYNISENAKELLNWINRIDMKRKQAKQANKVKRASVILSTQKNDWQIIFKREVKKAKNPNTGAKNASKIYRKKYGATARQRWLNALKKA